VSAWKRRALVVALVGTTASIAVFAPAAPAAAPTRPPLVEAAACAAPTPVAAPDGSRSDGTTQVSVQVPAVARLRVVDGVVVAAATNTGCAPRSTDRFVVGERDAPPAEVAAALHVTSGDWTTPGAWHPLG
jgi:hypothetical protein